MTRKGLTSFGVIDSTSCPIDEFVLGKVSFGYFSRRMKDDFPELQGPETRILAALSMLDMPSKSGILFLVLSNNKSEKGRMNRSVSLLNLSFFYLLLSLLLLWNFL